ncbi:lytic transglycosylase domain-containing protein [Mariprofundus ferrooxydans]|uniref:Soluble lytic murein transglycosylase n=1 Tax=Mariprofundus ferrooxydans PV-1 TaxID=314345 RepID=Q0F152_9PROT|nr:lytic transglycosylase domain-containing protein [Mariprofundus ferrooxydans]EAU55339.1 Soluble lytic murein transglycosylase [Mariprofundus ferrooxydans PV-1]KON47155.1 lytic murein transglycosylase [Mariprofundus ferrooxydans]
MRFLSWVIALCFIGAPAVQASTIEQQRDWFEQAHKALAAHQSHKFSKLKAKLDTYPLTPYLDIWQARKMLKAGTDDRVAAVLKTFADIPESKDLRIAWVKYLAERDQWSQVAEQLRAYPGLKRKYPEIAMMSDWYTGEKEAALQQFSQRWRNNDRLTDTSRSLHKAWLKHGHPNREERWSRIIHLADRGAWREIPSLSSGKREKQWLSYWHKLQTDPKAAFSSWPSSLSHPDSHQVQLAKAMIRDGLTRLARKDPLQADLSLQQLRKQLRLDAEDSFYDVMAQKIALRAAKQHMPIAAQWLGDLPAARQNEETRAWQARLYMLQQDWPKVLEVIRAMPRAEQQQARWQYWRAYALQSTGKSEEEATAVFAGLAQDRGYYSFLSAERINLPYNFSNEEMDALPALTQDLDKLPGIQRAREWLALGQYGKANREWYAALSGVSRKTWQAAAQLASQWNWSDQAIRAAYRAGKMNALDERFPLQFESDVMLAAKETGLDPASIWGVIRQESLFNRQALSPAGARGLMQLMPKTAKMVAGQINLHGGHRQLFSPAVNIRLGSRYLADMKSRFDNKLALAAAAYNAGPGRVSQWLERTPFDSSEVWVETIPYNETRRYVQHVIAYATVYKWRRQQSVQMHELALDVTLNEGKP